MNQRQVLHLATPILEKSFLWELHTQTTPFNLVRFVMYLKKKNALTAFAFLTALNITTTHRQVHYRV